jgi:hypothetical protein
MPKALKYVALLLMLGLGETWIEQTALSDTIAVADSKAPVQPQPGPPRPPKDTAADRLYPDPESGSVVGGSYANAYFGLSLPLPPGWGEGLAGPPPSARGLYVLSSMDGTRASRATLLIVAEDLFFSAKPFSNLADLAADFRASLTSIPDLSIDQGPAPIAIGGQAFLRLDYHAGGFYRGWLATELRCHLVSFNITATDRATVDHVADLLHAMSLPAQSETGTNAGLARTMPVCIKDYATAQTTIHRVDPAQVDLNGLTVPVRIIIGTNGKVEHVHVISATPAQRQAIEQALTQWQMKPLEVMGQPTEVETGLTFDFRPHRP